MKRQSNIICPYCPIKLHRWAALKTHIEEAHPDQEVPEWVLNETDKSRRKGQVDYRKGEQKRSKPKKVCPKCGEDLKNAYEQVKGKMVIKGLICPNKMCSHIIKNPVVVDSNSLTTDEIWALIDTISDRELNISESEEYDALLESAEKKLRGLLFDLHIYKQEFS